MLANCEELPYQLAIDGKAIKASCKRVEGKKWPPYIINVVDAATGKVYAQKEIEEKSSEIIEVPLLIHQMIDEISELLEGTTITTDALSTHESTFSALYRANTSFVSPVKANQKQVLEECNYFIQQELEWYKREQNKSLDFTVTSNKKHGRKEIRVFRAIQLEASSISLMDVSSICKVVRFREIIKRKKTKKSYSVKITYYQSSAPMRSKEFSEIIKQHWKVETMHFYLDVGLGEDYSSATKKAALSNLSLLRKAALNFFFDLKEKEAMTSFKDFCARSLEDPEFALTLILGLS